MKVKELQWFSVDAKEGFGPAACTGVSIAKTSGREMNCTRSATIWRVLLLTDNTEVPKPLCAEHRASELDKWEEHMALVERTAKAAKKGKGKTKSDPGPIDLEPETKMPSKVIRPTRSQEKVTARMVEIQKEVKASRAARRTAVVPEKPVPLCVEWGCLSPATSTDGDYCDNHK